MTQFISQQEVQNLFSEAKIPRPSSITAANFGDGQVLDISLGRCFRSAISQVRFVPGQFVEVKSTGRYEDFMSMASKRGELDRNLAFWKANEDSPNSVFKTLELSNVGISLAINTEIDGKQYAMLARRRMKEDNQRLMLISGYIDAAKFFKNTGDVADVSAGAHVILNAMAEGVEEALLAQQPGWFQQGEFRGSLIRNVASELTLGVGNRIECLNQSGVRVSGDYQDLDYLSAWWTMKTGGLPNYIKNVFTPPVVKVDDSVFDGAGFQLHMHTNSGQIIIGMKYEMDMGNRELLSLLHAEDGPLAKNDAMKAGLKADNAPGDLLATTLDRLGLVLCELDQDGNLTPNFFNFIEGSLVPAKHLGDLDKIFLSDAFVPSATTLMQGFVDQENIKATDYFQ